MTTPNAKLAGLAFIAALMSVFKGFSWAIKPGQGEGRGVSYIGFRGGQRWRTKTQWVRSSRVRVDCAAFRTRSYGSSDASASA